MQKVKSQEALYVDAGSCDWSTAAGGQSQNPPTKTEIICCMSSMRHGLAISTSSNTNDLGGVLNDANADPLHTVQRFGWEPQ